MRRLRVGPLRGAQPAAAPGVDSIELSQLRTELAERTADLQRLQAEYANYRRRVERDRVATQELALAGVLVQPCLPVLDDIGRARQHGELEGGLQVGRRGSRGDHPPSSAWCSTGAEGYLFDPARARGADPHPLGRRHRVDGSGHSSAAPMRPGEPVLLLPLVGAADPADDEVPSRSVDDGGSPTC